MTRFLLALISAVLSFSLRAEPGLPDDSLYQSDIQWTNQSDKPTKLVSFKGRPVVISMVYLSCNFSCPLTVNYMKEVEKLLPKELKEKVQFVLVSFDPERDKPVHLKEFSEKRKLPGKNWSLLTGKSDSEVREISALLEFKYKKLNNGEFDHSFSIAVLDSMGRLAGKFDGVNLKPAEIANAIKDLKPKPD